MRTTLALCLLLSACASTTTDPDDGGTTDDQSISIPEGSPDAAGVLRVANELTFTQLDVDVALPSNTAHNIVNHRSYTTIAALDAVPLVGASALGKLLAYARAHGYVVAPSRVATCTPPGSGAILPAPGPVTCGDEHWSFERPTPTGKSLGAVATFAANDVWTVGDGGAILHFNGATWSTEQAPICEHLLAMWGTSATNLWAVGEYGRIVHRTAAGWQLVDSGTCDRLSSIWGAPDGTLWIAGWSGLLHGDATHGFTQDTSARFASVYGFAADNIWAVDEATIHHYDGHTWTALGTGHWDLEQIWGSDPDHLFVAGFDWDKDGVAAWTFSPATATAPTETPLGGNRIAAIHGTSASDVWIVQSNQAWRYDGTTWKSVGTGGFDDINAIAARTPTDAWAVGESGARLHWDGTSWVDITGPQHGFSGVFARTPDDVWAASYTGVWHYDGTAWSEPLTTGFFNAVWASSATDVWAVGLDAQHFDGHTWTKVTLPVASGLGSGGLWSIGGSGPNDIWIGGANNNYTGKLAHWDGTAWTASSGAAGAVRAIYAPAPNDAWLATDKGLEHWDGSGWAIAGPLNSGVMRRITGTSKTNLWATGEGVWHYDGNTWTKLLATASPGTEQLDGLAVVSPTDVWVGSAGVFGGYTHLRHWDGAQWTTYVEPTSTSIEGIAVTRTKIFALDLGGGILAFH